VTTDTAVARPTLSRTALRRVLSTLCATETVSWGVLYYAFPVLAADISATTGWSTTSTSAAFSAGLIVAAVLGIPIGRLLDRHGPRWVMTAGSVLAGPSVVFIALAPNYTLFLASWLLAGVAMAGVLYPPAFAALTNWFGDGRVKALTLLTLAAGLASTVFAPLATALAGQLGWRDSYLVLAVLLTVITVPAHWCGLRGTWQAPERAAQTMAPSRTSGTRSVPSQIAHSMPFIALTIALSLVALTAYAVLVNLVPLFLERGLAVSTAALALGIGGIGQVAGRIAYPALTRWLGVRTRTVSILIATALTTALLGLLTSAEALITAAVIAGVARGLFTLIIATAVQERWGTEHYGRLTGLLSAPATLCMAIAPWTGAALATLLGSYSAAFIALAVLAGIGATFALSNRRPGTAR